MDFVYFQSHFFFVCSNFYLIWKSFYLANKKSADLQQRRDLQSVFPVLNLEMSLNYSNFRLLGGYYIIFVNICKNNMNRKDAGVVNLVIHFRKTLL